MNPRSTSVVRLLIAVAFAVQPAIVPAAVRYVKEAGADDITFMCVVAAPEGLARMQADHPDVPIVMAALDRELNDQAYILPGLGDFGDRLYGTEPAHRSVPGS